MFQISKMTCLLHHYKTWNEMEKFRDSIHCQQLLCLFVIYYVIYHYWLDGAYTITLFLFLD